MLKKWHKDTGDRPGLATLLKGWSDAKLDKYDVNIDEYDHSNCGSRPSILFAGYCTKKSTFDCYTSMGQDGRLSLIIKA